MKIKRILSIMLTLIMVVGMLPAIAMAETDVENPLYFTPNRHWLNSSTRFSVQFVFQNGSSKYEDLTAVGDGTYVVSDREGVESYIFLALRPDATSPMQFRLKSEATIKPSPEMNHFSLFSGDESTPTGEWSIKTDDGEINPPSEIIPDADDEVIWGFYEDTVEGCGSFREVIEANSSEEIYITLIRPVTLNQTLYISGGFYQIDLDGHNIISTADIPFLFTNTEVEIIDSKNSAYIRSASQSENYLFNVENSSLEISGGTYYTEGAGIVYMNSSSATTTVCGGMLFGGSYSCITVVDGRLVLDGGMIMSGRNADIIFDGETYSNNLNIKNLDSYDQTTLLFTDTNLLVPAIFIGSNNKVIATPIYDTDSVSTLCGGTVYRIGIQLRLVFDTTGIIDVVRRGENYQIPGYVFLDTGKKVDYWIDNNTNEQYMVGQEFIPERDMWFTAVWSEAERITVTFNSNGGSGQMEPKSIVKSAFYNLPQCTFTPPQGKAFKAWQIGNSTYELGEKVILEEDTEITAIWEDGVAVSFKANDGTGRESTIYVRKGTIFLLSENFFEPQENKVFKVWMIDGREYPLGKLVRIDEDTEILAVWEDGYTVTYSANGGTGSDITYIYNGETEIVLPDNKFKAPDNHDFICWIINGEEYNPGDVYSVSGTTVITAKWSRYYEIKYIYVNKVISNDVTYEHSDKAFYGSNYSFKMPDEIFRLSSNVVPLCWKSDEITYQFGDIINITDNITVTLDYKIGYKMVMMANEDSEEAEYYDVYKDEYFVFPECTFVAPEGYVFDYWQAVLNDNGKYKAGDSLLVRGGSSYYAVWKRDVGPEFVFEGYGDRGITFNVPVEGIYTLIFVDFECGKLNDIEIIPVTVTEENLGKITQASEKGLTLGNDDKIMLLSNTTEIMPLCQSYVICQ